MEPRIAAPQWDPPSHTIDADARHAAAAAQAVMLAEVAWFETLDRVTLWRIAYSAPTGSPEYRYAVDELARRADFSGEPEHGDTPWSQRV